MPAARTALGNLLQTRREALGLSRTRLGELARISGYTIEGWEIGRVAKPPIHDVLRLAQCLGLTTEEIELAVFEEEPSRPPSAALRRSSESPGAAVPLLEEAMNMLDWSAADAAIALGTTERTLERWRSGAQPMTLPEFMILTATIGMHVAHELSGDDARIADIAAAAQLTPADVVGKRHPD